MQSSSLCTTCSLRYSSFCGALLEDLPEIPDLHDTTIWRRHLTSRPGEQVATRNKISQDVFVLCNGWGFRFVQLPDGRRQILNFLLPGDLFSATSIFEDRLSFSVKALTAIQLTAMPRAQIQPLLTKNPKVLAALAKNCIAETQAADELATVLGRRSAEERIAYLLLHLMRRIAVHNVIQEPRYRFPLRQQHIADALGLTTVHVSRVLSLFRKRGIVELSEGFLQVFNPAELERIGSLN